MVQEHSTAITGGFWYLQPMHTAYWDLSEIDIASIQTRAVYDATFN